MDDYQSLEKNSEDRQKLSSAPPVRTPENVEMGGKIDSVTLYKVSTCKKFIRYFLYLITGGIFYLFNLWMPKLFIAMNFVLATIENADWIVILGADKNIEITPLTEEATSLKKYKVFMYRFFKYFYDQELKVFQPAQFSITNTTCQEIRKNFERGLDPQQVYDNKVIFGRNVTEVPRKSVGKLLIDEILSPFYIFQVYSFIVWILDAYAVYAGVIAFFSIVSVSLAVYETRKTMTKLFKMSYYVVPLTVWRNSRGTIEKSVINSDQLVPGDIIEIPENMMVPCDAILLNGTCIMNESMLTGESIPVVKNAIPDNERKYDAKEDKQYTLYSGTKCIQARGSHDKPAYALVTLTGFATVKGDLVRTMLFPKPSEFKFYADSFRFLGILAVMAFVGNAIDMVSWIGYPPDGQNISTYTMIIKASQIITVTVPPALPTCMQVGISVALSRLQKKGTFCISPNKINEAGRINIMCFDKTGTLTEDGLDVLGVRPIFHDKNTNELNFAKLIQDLTKLSVKLNPVVRERELVHYPGFDGLPSEHLLEVMTTCHSLTMVNGSLIGDPLDVKMFEATKWSIDEKEIIGPKATTVAMVKPPLNESSLDESPNPVGIVRRFEFASKLQRMSCVVWDPVAEVFRYHLKGSPEKVREMCTVHTIPKNFHKILSKYTENGYRVLGCGSKVLNMDFTSIMKATREDIEQDFAFTGFLIVENKLKPVTSQIISNLHDNEVQTIMVTGDNVLTAISVARQCMIVYPDQRIFLGELSEKKISGKNFIIWKDFEFSKDILNDELEPELNYDYEPTLQKVDDEENTDKFDDNLAGQANSKQLLIDEAPFDDDSDPGTPTRKLTSNFDLSVMDTDPPFFNMRDRDEYCIAITGKAYSYILDEAEKNANPRYQSILKKLLRKCLVYARMQPDEKASMIRHLQLENSNNMVGMCGDGANDCGALKTAHVGISLSEAEASIAAPFTSKIQDISCVPNLLREGKSALATSYQCFKYMALYSVIQFASVAILYYYFIDLTNWHYYHEDVLAVIPFSSTMAMSGTATFLTKYQPAPRLMSLNILLSVIGQAVIQASFQYFTFFWFQNQEAFNNETGIQTCIGNWENNEACSMNTVLYMVAIWQLAVVAFAFLVGRPFRKSFYTNCYFTVYLIFYMAFSYIMTMDPFQWFWVTDENLEDEFNIPWNWRNQIILIVVINSAVTIFWERIVVKYITIKALEYSEERNRKIIEAQETEEMKNRRLTRLGKRSRASQARSGIKSFQKTKLGISTYKQQD